MPEDNEETTEPRPFWSGTITFGLVSIPVEFYSATRPRAVSLRMVDGNGIPLSRRYVCPREEKPLERDEIVRGYEIDDGKYVIVTDEELEALEPGKTKEIDLRLFLDASGLDPLYFQRPYFLGPAGGVQKPYRLLAEAMEKSGRAGIATFVMRGREYIVAIISEGGILRAQTLRFADEIRSAGDVGLPQVKDAEKKTVDTMKKEIGKLSRTTFDTDVLSDPYAARLTTLVERKFESGEGVVSKEKVPEEPDGGKIIDLMAVLKKSFEAEAEEGFGRKRGKPGRGRKKRPPDLDRKTKSELYDMAQDLDIPNRSRMSKDELIKAIGKAS